MKYYFLGISLPPLSFDSAPDITFSRLLTLLQDNLSEKDMRKVETLRRLFDFHNIRSFWMGKSTDPYGHFDEVELEEALATRRGLPDYVYTFMDLYERNEERIKHFPQLLAQLFQHAAFEKDPFLKWFLNLEREIRLVLTAFRAKKLGRDLSAELQYENPEEDLIAQLLVQKDDKEFEPPEGFQDLKILFQTLSESPLEIQRALDEYRFNRIEEHLEGMDSFSIHRILAYLIEFIFIKRWSELNHKEGKKIVDTILKEV